MSSTSASSTRSKTSDRWLRLFGFQFGYHPNGRFRPLSERRGKARPWPTLRVGRTAEISACRFGVASKRITD